MTDSRQFLDVLGTELEAAAFRQLERDDVTVPRRRARLALPQVRILSAGTALAAIVLIAIVGIGVIASDDASPAAAFEITRNATSTTIDVVDVVEDLDAARRQLAAVGVDVSFDAVAVPPHLVDVALQALTDDAGATFVSGASGLERIELPRRFAGTLVVKIGRPARAGEAFAVSTPDPAICAALGGRRLADVTADLAALAPEIRYLVLDRPGADADRPVSAATDGDLVLVDLQFVSADEVVAILGPAGSDAGPAGCLSLSPR